MSTAPLKQQGLHPLDPTLASSMKSRPSVPFVPAPSAPAPSAPSVARSIGKRDIDFTPSSSGSTNSMIGDIHTTGKVSGDMNVQVMTITSSSRIDMSAYQTGAIAVFADDPSGPPNDDDIFVVLPQTPSANCTVTILNNSTQHWLFVFPADGDLPGGYYGVSPTNLSGVAIVSTFIWAGSALGWIYGVP